jgi:hypothetical protein
MQLNSKTVEVEGFGEVEFREPLFKDISAYIGKDDLALRILELSAHQDGKRIFDGTVGVAFGLALMKHVETAMEVCGFPVGKKDLVTEIE